MRAGGEGGREDVVSGVGSTRPMYVLTVSIKQVVYYAPRQGQGSLPLQGLMEGIRVCVGGGNR